MREQAAQRVVFVDAARAAAIALALFIHGLVGFDVHRHLPALHYQAINLFTRAATPTFVFLFGAMLELVYVRKAEDGGFASIVPRLLQRSLLCYLAYLVTLLFGWASGEVDARRAFTAALFVGQGRVFTEILKYYAVALLLAIPLLRLRLRHGLAWAAGICLGLWLLVPFLGLIPWPARHTPSGYFTAFLFGRPMRSSSLSLLHAMPLVGAGMVMGSAIAASRTSGDWRRYRRTMTGLMAGSLAVVLALALSAGPGSFIGGILGKYRSQHRLGYYAFGLLQALALTFLISRLVPPETPYTRARARWLVFGRSSLLAFTLGSVVLSLWPRADSFSLAGAFAKTLLYLALVMTLLLLIEWARERKVQSGPPGG
jgi:hypothetical protein